MLYLSLLLHLLSFLVLSLNLITFLSVLVLFILFGIVSVANKSFFALAVACFIASPAIDPTNARVLFKDFRHVFFGFFTEQIKSGKINTLFTGLGRSVFGKRCPRSWIRLSACGLGSYSRPPICFNLRHPQPSLFLFALESPLWCFSSLAKILFLGFPIL